MGDSVIIITEYKHKIMKKLFLAGTSLALTAFAERECKAIDLRVTDEWCLLDCECDICPGCNQDYCAGFCDYVDDDPTTAAPTTAGELTTRGPTEQPVTAPF